MFEMRKINSGKFLMGSPKSELGREDNEKQVEVEITKPFEMMIYPVTHKQWTDIMGYNPSYFHSENKELGTDNFPVEQVTRNDIQRFLKKLNEKTSEDYRLPTEAEWEFAVRAGTKTTYFFGDDPEELKDYAWYIENSGKMPHKVGQKKPNPNGLYDVYGNVWEWVQDSYNDTLPGGKDPLVKTVGGGSVVRGGSYKSSTQYLRSAFRFKNYEALSLRHVGDRVSAGGFRLIRTL